MIQFFTPELTDRDLVDSYFLPSGYRCCEYAFTNIFAWRDAFHEEITAYAGYLTVRCATPADAPRMQELWRRCFGDEQAYLDLCFDQGDAVSHGMLLEAEGAVQSMLLVFSQEMTLPEGDSVPMWYVYAFCTHPDGQSRGYGRILLAWTEEEGRKAGAKAVVMVPGEPSLFRFYESLGYETACFTWETEISRETKTPPRQRAERCDVETYQVLRERFLQGTSHVSCPLESLTWQKMLCDASGGGLFRIGDGVAAAECWGGSVILKELLAHQLPEAAQAVLTALNALNADHALVRTVLPGTPKPFGVVQWLDKETRRRWNQGQNRYLALAFD